MPANAASVDFVRFSAGITLPKKIARKHPDLAKRFTERSELLDAHLKAHHPDVYEKNHEAAWEDIM